MANDTAWTQAHLDEIEKAIAAGTLRVKYADKEIEYRSVEEMYRIRDSIRNALGKTPGRNKRIYVEFSRDL